MGCTDWLSANLLTTPLILTFSQASHPSSVNRPMCTHVTVCMHSFPHTWVCILPLSHTYTHLRAICDLAFVLPSAPIPPLIPPRALSSTHTKLLQVLSKHRRCLSGPLFAHAPSPYPQCTPACTKVGTQLTAVCPSPTAQSLSPGSLTILSELYPCCAPSLCVCNTRHPPLLEHIFSLGDSHGICCLSP